VPYPPKLPPRAGNENYIYVRESSSTAKALTPLKGVLKRVQLRWVSASPLKKPPIKIKNKKTKTLSNP